MGYPKKQVRVKTQGGVFKIAKARMYKHSGGIKKYEENAYIMQLILKQAKVEALLYYILKRAIEQIILKAIML
ncbi:MAG: hypothetical protein BGO76_01720 [Caedibacter sp. 38-128]|nr:MAG: hypothetical protein BGO76_01720 [Caedibacter sp. 38-128]